MTTRESEAEKPTGPAIPNFRDDERAAQRYASLLERRIKDYYREHDRSIRDNAAQKRDELRLALFEAELEYNRRKEVADIARAAYAKSFPNNVKKMRLVVPSTIDNMKSLGAAQKLYTAAREAWLAAETAASNIRRLEHNEPQIDIELEKALERAPVVCKEVTESEKWLTEVHLEEELGGAKARVEAIAAEREEFAQRLAAGTVPPDELRLRAFAEAGVKPVTLPIDAFVFLRIEQYGPQAYFILRDIGKKLYSLPYDRRLEPLLDGVYDIFKNNNDFTVRRAIRVNTRVPYTLPEHFVSCAGNQEAGMEEFRQFRAWIRERRMLETMTEAGELETKVIGLLVDFAAADKER